MAEKVNKRFASRERLRFKDVAAFQMKNGRIESIMDEDFKLISAEALDGASQEIADDFSFLLNL